mmetsp:Transcript_96279/g.272148  ORF Transcript_96279/g.272148 Transcript_96279/m.272148 type:complete len:288 (+) Transcript_96279:753-1616(+)
MIVEWRQHRIERRAIDFRRHLVRPLQAAPGRARCVVGEHRHEQHIVDSGICEVRERGLYCRLRVLHANAYLETIAEFLLQSCGQVLGMEEQGRAADRVPHLFVVFGRFRGPRLQQHLQHQPFQGRRLNLDDAVVRKELIQVFSDVINGGRARRPYVQKQDADLSWRPQCIDHELHAQSEVQRFFTCIGPRAFLASCAAPEAHNATAATSCGPATANTHAGGHSARENCDARRGPNVPSRTVRVFHCWLPLGRRSKRAALPRRQWKRAALHGGWCWCQKGDFGETRRG